MHGSQEELVEQQRIIAGCLIRREMRSCGIWGPMPKMDGTSLPPALLARFPKSPEGMKYLDYEDKVALLGHYSLTAQKETGWVSPEETDELLYRFITGKGSTSEPTVADDVRDMKPRKVEGKENPPLWAVFAALLGFLVIVLLIIKMAPPEAYLSQCR